MPVNILCGVFVDTCVICDFVFPNIFNLHKIQGGQYLNLLLCSFLRCISYEV